MLEVIVEGCEPTRGTQYSACIDLRASEDVVIINGETKMVGLGVKISSSIVENIINSEYSNSIGNRGLNEYRQWFYESHYMQLMLRSSLGKKGLIIPNGVGIIDIDYRDEIKILIHNTSNSIKISKGDRIAQIALLEHKTFMFDIETDTQRAGGFGSTN